MSTTKRKTRFQLWSIKPHILVIVSIVVSTLLYAAVVFSLFPSEIRIFILVICVILTGYDIVFDFVRQMIKTRDFNENILIVLAAAGAFLIERGTEGAAVLIIFRIGGVIATKVATKSSDTIKNLIDLRPDTVNAVVNGAIVRQVPGKIKVGETISVSPGEWIALDGVVLSGDSSLDISAIFGGAESVPVRKDSRVWSGSLNRTGVLNIRVTHDFDNSVVSRVLRNVENATEKKSTTEKVIRKYARFYVPAIMLVAIIIGIVVPAISGLPFDRWLTRGLGFLVISSTSALVLSISLTYLAGIGGAAKKGILIKNADIVDTVARTTSVVFDKTGVLTTGKYRVVEIDSLELSVERLMMLAAYAELNSSHPIAQAIVAAADIEPEYSRITNFREIPGRGTEIEIAGNSVVAGNELLMNEMQIKPDKTQIDATVVYIAVNERYAGRILLSDTIQPDAKKAVKALHALGIDRIALFTGDNKEVAADVASQLGIKEFYAECLAVDKYSRLKGLMEMQLSGDKLVYVGDGVNDQPVLDAADIGVTLGNVATDQEFENADIHVLTSEPSKIAAAISMSRGTVKTLRQNILLTVGLKGLVFILLAFGIASMWMAALADVAISLAIVIDAMGALGMKVEEINKLRPRRVDDKGDIDNTELS